MPCATRSNWFCGLQTAVLPFPDSDGPPGESRPFGLLAHMRGLIDSRKVALPLVVRPRVLRSATDAWIEAVARIKALKVIDQCRIGIVQIAETVLSRKLRATSVQ